MTLTSLARTSSVASAGAIILYLLQPLPALLFGARMADDPSFHPTWVSGWWIAAVVVFGFAVTACMLTVGRRPARILSTVVVSTVLYLAVACVGIMAASSDPVQAVNSASVLVLWAFTYYLNGWIAAIIALAVVMVTLRLEGQFEDVPNSARAQIPPPV